MERPDQHVASLNPLPPFTQVRCESDTRLQFMPAWSDPCDRASTMVTFVPTGFPELDGEPTPPPAWWPCDESGELKPDTAYLPL
jgi:hypothetical protein